MLRELSILLSGFTCVALLSASASASELPPLRCGTVKVPGATCTWMRGGACTWEEGGSPTVCAPVSGAGIELRTAGTYRGGYNNGSASNGAAYDAKTQRLFVANGATQAIEVVKLGGRVVDAYRPQRLAKECSINVANPGFASPPSGYTPFNIALRKDGILEVVLQDRDDATRQGLVALYDARGGCSAPPLSVISSPNPVMQTNRRHR